MRRKRTVNAPPWFGHTAQNENPGDVAQDKQRSATAWELCRPALQQLLQSSFILIELLQLARTCGARLYASR
jgi:hypothetical protein